MSLFSPRINPPILSVTSGTKIDKFVHGLNLTGLHSKHNVAVRRANYSQVSTELLKLQSDASMQHFIHKASMFVDYDEYDFALMNTTIPPNLMQDLDKTWNSLDYASLKSLLDLFFTAYSPMNLITALNGAISDIYNKYKNDPVGYTLYDYYTRTRIGVWLQAPIGSVEIYNRVCDEFLINYFKDNGFAFLHVHSQALRNDGFDGKSDLNKYFNSNFDILNDPIKYPNGIVAMSPPWGYASRSMTEGRLDIALNLRNSVNTQDNDRVMSNCRTLDGKKKLLGLVINAGFRSQTQDWSSEQTDCLRNLFKEQREDDLKTQHLGPWLRGVNIFQRIAGTNPVLMQGQALESELTNSDKAFRDMLSVDLTNLKFWGKTDILLKLHIVRGNKKSNTLITNIKKRATNPNKKISIQQLKSDERKVKEIYVQILESLFGFIIRISGFAAQRNFTTVRNTLEAISLEVNLDKLMQTTIGISADDYIELLDESNGLPVSTMDYILNSIIAEVNHEL